MALSCGPARVGTREVLIARWVGVALGSAPRHEDPPPDRGGL